MSAGDGTVTPGNFATSLLSALGLPTTTAYTNVINAWAEAESGNANQWRNNNPLNAKCSPNRQPFGVDTGAIGCDPGNNTIIFGNLSDAVQAYANQLHINTGGYGNVIRAKSPLALANAITASSWDAGHYRQYHATVGQTKLTGLAAFYYKKASSVSGFDANAWLKSNGENVGLNQGSSTSGSGVGTPGGIDLNPADWVGAIGGAIGGAITNIIFLFIGVVLILIGLWKLVGSDQTSAADIATAVLAATQGGHVSYSTSRGLNARMERNIRPQRRGGEDNGTTVTDYVPDAPEAETPSVPVEEAIQEPPRIEVVHRRTRAEA